MARIRLTSLQMYAFLEAQYSLLRSYATPYHQHRPALRLGEIRIGLVLFAVILLY